ncbi:MAG: ComEC/Rec2 family competence protein [Egibacteraceae bacterium]
MSVATAWLLAGALWVGCLLPGPWWFATAALAALMLAGAAVRPGRRRRWLVVLAAVALGVAGAGLAGGRDALADDGLLPALADRGGVAALEGVVVAEPRISPSGAWTVVRTRAVDGRRTRERALVRLRDRGRLPRFGEPVALRASARPLGREGFDAYARRLYAHVELYPVGPMRVTGDAPPVIRVTTIVRERTRAAAARHLDPDRAGLLTGLVTGDTRGLSTLRADQLADAGLSHLVAVSGSNVALVLAGVLGLARVVGVGARGRRWIGLGAVCWFALLARAEPSVLRASVMAVLVLLAGGLGRGLDPPYTLAVAVLVLLLADPAIAGQLGFGLSVLATAGVLLLAPSLARRLPGPRLLRLLVAASLGAQLGVAALLLRVEGAVPLASIPANLVAVPAATVASAIGGVAALAAQLSAEVGGAVSWLAGPPLSLILWAGQRFADGPRLGPVDLLTPAALVLACALLTWRRAPRLAAAGIAVAVALSVLPVLRGPGAPAGVQLTAFDVGQGDALLVEALPGARMLVDGGPDPGLALRELRARGIRRLDAVALTHPHADHSGGLPAVLAAVEVGVLLVGPTPLETLDDVAPSVVATYGTAAARGIPVETVAAGQRFALGAARVEVLSPPADGSLGEEPNESSLVLRVLGREGAMLLAGDVEVAAQTRLLARPDRLRASVLKVPHHGGDTNAPGFLDAVGAGVAVISAGAANDYGHPTRAVLDALRGADLRRTDTDGTVTVTLGGGTGPRVAIAKGLAGDHRVHVRPPADVPDRGPRGTVARRRRAELAALVRGRSLSMAATGDDPAG